MPITATGHVPRTLADVVEALEDSLRSRISDKLDLSERSVLGNLVQILAAELVGNEELNHEAYVAFDIDNASDDRVVALGLLLGVPRRGARKGLVTVTLNLDAGQTYAAGDLVAHVTNEADNRWTNRDAVVSTTAGAYSAVFASESTGAGAIAPAGTLTIIAEPIAGWNTVTNAAAATPGTDIEAIEDLRLRIQLATASGGSRTRNAIRAKLVNVEGVLSVEVFENTSNVVDANGIPPHAIRAVVWDGSPAAADDNDIAQAIYDHKAEGISSDGGELGIAQDEVLGPVPVAFARAIPIDITVAVEIESEDGVSADDVADAIVAAMPDRVGDEVTYNRLAKAVFDVVGVDDWVTFTINGGTTDLPGLISSIYLLDASDVTVTGDVT